MKHQYHNPGSAIANYVRTILSLEGITPTSSLPVIPQGTAALVFKISGKKQQLVLFGNLNSKHIKELYHCSSVIAYFFRPFVASSLFAIPAKELKENSHDLVHEKNLPSQTTFKRLSSAVNIIERIAVLDAFINNLIIKNGETCRQTQRAVEWMLDAKETDSITELLKELKITERTLQRSFKKYVGISPNQFRRFSQFQSAFQHLRSMNYKKLSDIAYEHGYADQSHFGRTFREFIELTPNEYLKHGLPLKKD